MPPSYHAVAAHRAKHPSRESKVGFFSWKKRLATTVHCHCSERARVSIPGWGVKGDGGGGGGEGTVSQLSLPFSQQSLSSSNLTVHRVGASPSGKVWVPGGGVWCLCLPPPAVHPRCSVKCGNNVNTLLILISRMCI